MALSLNMYRLVGYLLAKEIIQNVLSYELFVCIIYYMFVVKLLEEDKKEIQRALIRIYLLVNYCSTDKTNWLCNAKLITPEASYHNPDYP